MSTRTGNSLRRVQALLDSGYFSTSPSRLTRRLTTPFLARLAQKEHVEMSWDLLIRTWVLYYLGRGKWGIYRRGPDPVLPLVLLFMGTGARNTPGRLLGETISALCQIVHVRRSYHSIPVVDLQCTTCTALRLAQQTPLTDTECSDSHLTPSAAWAQPSPAQARLSDTRGYKGGMPRPPCFIPLLFLSDVIPPFWPGLAAWVSLVRLACSRLKLHRGAKSVITVIKAEHLMD
jgi:hypothetical protein